VSTISPLAEPLGGQAPRVAVAPQSASSAGAEAVELAASAGLILDPWQQVVLEAALGERPDGRWSSLEVGLVVPRQNGKGAVIEARELAGLFLFGEDLILHSAHEFKTAQEAFRRLLHLVETTPDLDRRVARVRTSHGEEGVELVGGGRLRFVARSNSSTRGFSGDCLILDEAFRLPPHAVASLLPTMSARPNPQLWVLTSSPPTVDESSEHVRRMRARALSDDPGRLCWFEWSSPAEVDPDDRSAWAAANPALGVRLEAEFVETERAAYTDETFLVERLGVWLEASTSSKIPAEAWERAFDPDASVDPAAVVFALDMPPDRSVVSVAVSDGRVVELAAEVPPGEVVDWLRERVARWRPRAVVVDSRGPASTLIQALEELDVQVVTTSARAFAEACGRFYDAVVSGQVRHRGQGPLTAAAGSASTRALGDSWAWARSSSAVNISPLVAASLAVSGAETVEVEVEAPRRPVFVY
jgi:phage terminase large subunit-like protein